MPRPASSPRGERGTGGAVLVCLGEACRQAGADAVRKRLVEESAHLTARRMTHGWVIAATSCLGRCDLAPVVQLSAHGGYCGGSHAEIVRAVREQLLAEGPAPASTSTSA